MSKEKAQNQRESNAGSVEVETVVRPHRAFELDVKIGADTREDIDRAVLALLQSLERDWKGMNTQESVSGGMNWGWVLTLRHDPDMTHEKYFEDIETFRKNSKKVSA